MRLFFRVIGAALVLVLVWGLVVVAITRVREAAARTTCSNNLKQIGVTLSAYADSNGHFPTATFANDKLPPEKRLSWQVRRRPGMTSKVIHTMSSAL